MNNNNQNNYLCNLTCSLRGGGGNDNLFSRMFIDFPHYNQVYNIQNDFLYFRLFYYINNQLVSNILGAVTVQKR